MAGASFGRNNLFMGLKRTHIFLAARGALPLPESHGQARHAESDPPEVTGRILEDISAVVSSLETKKDKINGRCPNSVRHNF